MEKHTTVIKPATGLNLHLRELWEYRELLYFFAWRDIKVKYKQTALGILWALLQPLGMMLVFVLLFSRSSLASSTGVGSYEVFVLSGLVLWSLFYHAVSHASESMIANAAIIKKIYFPRLVIPLSSLFSALVDFSIGLLLLLVFCFIKGQPLHISILLYAPLAAMLLLVAAFGAGTLLGAFNVKYRDFRYALPFLLQLVFFSSQVIYPASLLQDERIRYVFALNPVNAALEIFRIPFGAPVHMDIIWIGTGMALLLAIIGISYFRKTESYFADIV